VVALLYEGQGNQVQRRGGANPDGGIDLVVLKAHDRLAVQCKHWKTWKVKLRDVRDFFGGMTAEGFDRGIFVALSGCTNEAREFADRNGVAILEANDIEEMLAQADEGTLSRIRLIIEDPTKHCPKCGAPMVIRGPYAGSRFWGCSTYGRTRCKGKIQITD
jgi:restriction system protein